jgi:hypothetical protein
MPRFASRGQRAPRYPQPLAPQFGAWSAVSVYSPDLGNLVGAGELAFREDEGGSLCRLVLRLLGRGQLDGAGLRQESRCMTWTVAGKRF